MDNQSSVKKVLVVEDNLVLSLLLEKLILKLGYEVVGKATTGANAIKMAFKLNPDIITMDICLQDDIDGIMAAQQIQERAPIQIIYITANTDNHNFTRAKKTQFIDFLAKPVSQETLAKSFQKASSKNGSLKSLESV